MRQMICTPVALAALLLAPPAAAQNEAEAAAQNMQLAAELCLRNYHNETELPQVFGAAGFTVSPDVDQGTYEFNAPGISGIFKTDTHSGYCTVQSSLVPLPMANAIGRALGDRLFPGKVEEGGAEHTVGQPVGPCDGVSVFAPRQMITISYSAADNSGDCLNDGTSAIIIRM